MTGSNVLGSLAVGQNLIVDNVGIASSLNVSCAYYSLIVGNVANFPSGSIYHGSPVVSSSKNDKINSHSACGVILNPTYLNWFFPFVRSYLISLSSTLRNKQTTGTVLFTGKTITLQGSFSTREVFSVQGNDLSNAVNIKIGNVSENVQLILINVDGTSDQMRNLGSSNLVQFNSKIIFNFFQATSLTIHGTSVQGTVLAMNADITSSSAQFNGQVFGNSWNGNSEIRQVPFTGCIC